MTREEWVQTVDTTCAILAEHCDSVRIFVTVTDHDGDEEKTYDYNTGRGNYLTSIGQVQEWLWASQRRIENDIDRRDKS